MGRRMKKSEKNFVVYDAQKCFIDNLEQLVGAAKDCALSEDFIAQYREYIDAACGVLQLSEQELLMLCPFLNNSDRSFDLGDIGTFFGCTSMRLMRYISAIKSLRAKGYLKMQSRNETDSFKLTYKALVAISQGKCLEILKCDNLSPMEFIKTLDNLFNDKCMGRMDDDLLIEEVLNLLRENGNLNIVKRVIDLDLSIRSRVILLYFCANAIWKNNIEIECDDLVHVFDGWGNFVFREIMNGTHNLVKLGLIEVTYNSAVYGPNETLMLTEVAQEDLLKVDFNFILKKNDKSFHNVLKSETVVKKSLFFGEKNRASLATLKELLDEKKLMEIREQLKNKGWGLGFTCLFYGAPGTGKTESVLQIARESGRDIMQVDISSARNKWYGETEKQIKKIFTDYKDLVKQSKKTPILLFNEADAILSVRSELGSDSSSISKTENAIQNILLQEMETFDGILIATTNLINNLDAAFERRFLYKIKFEKPDIEAKGEIWRSLMPALTKDEAKMLASEFDFSGGEISNIARKCFINELLFNDATTLEQIKEVCGQEKLTKRVRIGF